MGGHWTSTGVDLVRVGTPEPRSARAARLAAAPSGQSHSHNPFGSLRGRWPATIHARDSLDGLPFFPRGSVHRCDAAHDQTLLVIRNGVDPREWTYSNMDRMRGQLRLMGAGFDWDREVVTSDPEYYRWTQWWFLKLYEHGLAYRALAR